MENISTPENKRKISRSPRFPAYPLEVAIETVQGARKLGRNLTDAQLAGSGSTNSGAFLRKKAALGYFGLIAGRGTEVHVTDLAETIIYPKPGEKELAVRQAFLTPEIFKKLYVAMAKNEEIPLSALGNVLIRDYEIQPGAKNEFLSVFIKSGIFCELLKFGDDTRSTIVFLDPKEEKKEEVAVEEKNDSAPVLTNIYPTYKYDAVPSGDTQNVELSLTKGKGTIIVPKELTAADAKRLKAQIDILANIFDE